LLHLTPAPGILFLAPVAKLLLPLDAKYLMKKEMFKWPLRKMFLKIGGVPVDRSRNQGLTEAMIEYIKTHDRAAVVYPAEGTRKRVSKWRKGFYYAAVGAQVPIVMAFIDFKEKKAGIGPSFIPTGNIEQDLKSFMTSTKMLLHANRKILRCPNSQSRS